MDANRFDTVSRLLSAAPSRRQTILGILAALGLKASTTSSAKKGKKRKNPRLNEFGCVNVGGACFGKDSLCCSGRCEGQKPKKGKQDKRRCVAHDASDCEAGQRACDGLLIACVTSNGNPAGACQTTTGNAPYCSQAGVSCRACKKDDDCVSNCGAGAACVKCDGASIGCFADGDAFCVGLDQECT